MNRLLPWLLAVLLAVGVFFKASDAHAYPWMIRHGYTQCATCHTDPGGAGLLTPYGRAQSDLLLSAKYTSKNTEEEEASKTSEFALGLIPQPDWLSLQAWFRGGHIWNFADGDQVDTRNLLMRGDVGVHVKTGIFRASATMGIALNQGASLSHEAWVTSNKSDSGANLISREHWIGVSLFDDRALVRAGRLNLPFGLRNLEHTSYVRQATRTDFNQQQQHGIAFAYATEKTRAEGMLVLGNFQTGPDSYRERGVVGTVETAFAERAALGFNALVVRAARDDLAHNVWRQAYGVHARYAPWKPLVFLGELDFTLRSATNSALKSGYAAFVQADFEPWQGLHFVTSFEGFDASLSDPGWSRRVGVGAAFFPVAHLDIRGDYYRSWSRSSPTIDTVLIQLHGYL